MVPNGLYCPREASETTGTKKELAEEEEDEKKRLALIRTYTLARSMAAETGEKAPKSLNLKNFCGWRAVLSSTSSRGNRMEIFLLVGLGRSGIFSELFVNRGEFNPLTDH